jgi:hypothetical protein
MNRPQFVFVCFIGIIALVAYIKADKISRLVSGAPIVPTRKTYT